MQAIVPPRLDVTVVMPAYNRATLVTRALDSLLAQSAWPQRLIVVDDASSDGTAEQVEAWARRTGYPVLVERMAANAGAAAARNRGMALATTRYIAFLDTDDEHLPRTLEKLVSALDTHPDAVVAFGDATKVTPTKTIRNAMFLRRVDLGAIADYVGSDSVPVHALLDAKLLLLRSSLIPTCSSCFLREHALAIGGMPQQYRTGEDWMFWLKLSERGKFVFYTEDLAIVHRHPDNLTNPQSAELTARLKLAGFAALLSGEAGIAISPSQRDYIHTQVQVYVTEWRYQLSRLGFRRYWAGMLAARQWTGQSFLANALADPKSMLRAMAASMITLPAVVPE